MLHIVWLLIKIILIILGIVLGLAVLLLLLLLFCPVRYSVLASKAPGNLRNVEARVKVSWLFGGVSLRLFVRNGENTQDIRLLGIPVLRFIERWKARKTSSGNSRKNRGELSAESSAQKEKIAESVPTAEETDGNKDTGQEQRPAAAGMKIPEDKTVKQQNNNLLRWIENKIYLLKEKLKGIRKFFQEIPRIIRKISLTIQNIYGKIDSWKRFAEHPRVRAAIILIKEDIKKLLHHVFPRKISGSVRFGSEDPSVTGAVLAVLGMTFPVHQNRVEIQPVFENENLLEGNIKMKGRIYGIVPLKIFIELYFDKNIKYIISRWKNKED